MYRDWEVLADAMEEVNDWLTYEEDLSEGDPWA